MRKLKAKKTVIAVTPTQVIFDDEAPNVPVVEETVFGDEEEAVAVAAPAEIVDVETAVDLADVDRKEISDTLREIIPVKERARLLATLARFKDTKRAPVGLRAIQVINELTGVTEAQKSDTPPMFMLPENTSISIKVTNPEK